jgi:hypothetical protein
MFTVSTKNSFSWPVSFRIPTDGGGYETADFDAEFKRITQSKIEELFNKLSEGTINDRQVADEVLIGWKGVQDDSGKPLNFTDATKARLLDVAGLAGVLVMAYTDALRGAREKN